MEKSVRLNRMDRSLATRMPPLTPANKGLEAVAADQSPYFQLISSAGLLMGLCILALLFLVFMLVRSLRRLKPRPYEPCGENQPEEDLWMEAGRRLRIDESRDS